MARPLTFVTGNANKLREVRAILSSGAKPIEVVSQSVDVAEIQGSTQEIARFKCSEAARLVGGPVVTEDTALCFAALGGLPGPYIRAFLEAVGHDGLNRMLDGFGDRREATALCTFGYCAGPGVEPILFEGECAGRIVPARGPTHFGLSLRISRSLTDQAGIRSSRFRAPARRASLRTAPTH